MTYTLFGLAGRDRTVSIAVKNCLETRKLLDLIENERLDGTRIIHDISRPEIDAYNKVLESLHPHEEEYFEISYAKAGWKENRWNDFYSSWINTDHNGKDHCVYMYLIYCLLSDEEYRIIN